MTASTIIIRKCIRQLLEEHVTAPFAEIREADLQAKLAGLIRGGLTPPTVPVIIDTKSPHQYAPGLFTSRVHLEMKVTGDLRCDVVVLRAERETVLTCYKSGPTDIVRRLRPDDVEAVVEIKAAPSRFPGIGDQIASDIRKLGELQRKHPQISCFFVLVDKSISVPGAKSRTPLDDDRWRNLVSSTLKPHPTPSSTSRFIEAWDLVRGASPSPRIEYWHE